MKVSIASLSLLLALASHTASSSCAFAAFTSSPKPFFGGQHAAVAATRLNAEIRSPTEKAQELRFGWDGTTALGGAVEVAKPARMLDQIRAAGETVPGDCEVFNGNLQMGDGSDITFKDVMELIDTHYESQLLEFKNGNLLNKPGENEGSAKILSYAALSNLDEKNTLKLFGEYYRDVVQANNPNGTDHQNIRNFIKYGWKGVPFENGIALTRKNVGEGEWDTFAESWIP